MKAVKYKVPAKATHCDEKGNEIESLIEIEITEPYDQEQIDRIMKQATDGYTLENVPDSPPTEQELIRRKIDQMAANVDYMSMMIGVELPMEEDHNGAL